MQILEKTVRSAAITVAVLFIGLSVFGMFGVWLGPRLAQIQQALASVRDAVGTIGNAVSLVSALPMMPP